MDVSKDGGDDNGDNDEEDDIDGSHSYLSSFSRGSKVLKTSREALTSES